MIQDVAALDSAQSGDLSVFCDAKRTDDFANSQASVIVTNALLGQRPHNGSYLLLVDEPRLAFARIGQMFYPAAAPHGGVHPSARIDPGAFIGADSQIGPGVCVGPAARIGARCHIGSNVAIGDGVVIGDDCVIEANSVISHAVIGSRVQISSNVSIGSEGFGFVPCATGLLRIAQLGRVMIADGAQIGANCAIDRGTMDDTVIGAGTVIDNLVQIGHNVNIGRHCVLAGQVGIAGSTTLGDGVMVGGQSAISDHVTIGSGARIAGKSGVIRDVAAGESVGGCPAVPIRQWHRQNLMLARLGTRNLR